MKDCCVAKKSDTKCFRKSDKKVFTLPRKFTKEKCMQGIKGFTMRASCAPYKDCAFDVYVNKNPKDTIPIKFKNVQNVKQTILKLEKLFKSGKYSHKRIWQVGMILMVRLRPLKESKPAAYALAQRYFKFLGRRTKSKDRKNMSFTV